MVVCMHFLTSDSTRSLSLAGGPALGRRHEAGWWRRGLRLAFAIAVVIGSAGCLATKPATESLSLTNPACSGTMSGSACLTLEFTVSDSVRKSAGTRCKGFLHWGLYAGGDVGLTGPGGNASLQGGTVPSVDLSEAGASYGLTRADVKPGSYQVLGYITQTLNAMGAVSGDPVTFPSAAFAVPQDVNTHVSVVFDYVR